MKILLLITIDISMNATNCVFALHSAVRCNPTTVVQKFLIQRMRTATISSIPKWLICPLQITFLYMPFFSNIYALFAQTFAKSGYRFFYKAVTEVYRLLSKSHFNFHFTSLVFPFPETISNWSSAGSSHFDNKNDWRNALHIRKDSEFV